MVAPPLSPVSRRDALEEMAADELDVLVIGAGVVGAGAALDDATRGLKVGLVEGLDVLPNGAILAAAQTGVHLLAADGREVL